MNLSVEELLNDSRYSMFFSPCNLSSADRDLVNEYIVALTGVLSDKRLVHSVLSTLTAVKLDVSYDLGIPLVSIIQSAMLHDCARELPVSEILSLAAEEPDSIIPEAQRVALLHGRAGAEIAITRYGITNPSVIEAIRYHTTGLAGGCDVLGVLIGADYLEPGRFFHEQAPKIENYSSFQNLLIEILGRKIEWVIRDRKWLSPLTIDCYNRLLQ